MWLFLLVLFTLHGTTPCSLASDSLDCVGARPATSLLRLSLVGWRQNVWPPETLATLTGLAPCVPFTISADDRGLAWQLAVVSFNAGGASCLSNTVSRNWPATGVPGVPARADSQVFDLMGRRIHGRPWPGIYFVRDSHGRKRMVMFR